MLKDNLKLLREKNNLTKKQVADAIGVTERAYITYEYGQRDVSTETLQRLADFYRVTTDYLLGRPEATPPENPIDQIPTVDEMERDLFREWLTLDKSARTAFLDVLRNIVAADNQRKMDAEARRTAIVHTCPIQISLHKVSAGTGYDLEDGDAWKTIDIADTETARNADFGLEVEGDSMEPKYHDGDIILVKKTPAVDVGDDCVYMINGAGYVKQYGGDRLISLNKDYEDIYFHDYDYDSIHCVGKVIGVAERA